MIMVDTFFNSSCNHCLMIKLTWKFLWNWVPVLVYMGFIYYLSSLPQVFSSLPLGSGNLLQELDFSSMLYHVLEYAILGLLIWKALSSYKVKNSQLLSIFIVILYGITDEIHQIFVPLRVFSFLDILMDGIGGVVAQSLVNVYYWMKRNVK